MVESISSPIVEPAAVAEFIEKTYEIKKNILEKAITLFPDALPQDGPEVLEAGLDFILKGFASAMEMGELKIMDYQIEWGMDRLPHDGVSSLNVLATFRLVGEVVNELLSPGHAHQVQLYIDWSLAKIESMISTDSNAHS
jgi:hypothetical protein